MNTTRMFSIVTLAALLAAWGEAGEVGLPPGWQERWDRPPPADRPLQIVHGIPTARATPEGMTFYQDRGLGGLVCNVAFDRYLHSDEHWKTLADGVEACRRLGLVVWLYDEEGYPSGSAGGLVLAENPALEALELAHDPGRAEPFFLRRAYEHSHAANNYHAARRFPNLIDARAVASFLDKTHEAYRRRLEPHLGRTIEAFFTDEPSLMAVDLGQLPDEARRRVRVVDPVDPTVPALASVPWCDDLPAQYRNRWDEDLMVQRASLFGGNRPEDRRVRGQFWNLISELMAERYFGAIQTWCGTNGVAASGHVLWEERLIHHVPLMGNALACLERMDIPGLDMLSSDPPTGPRAGWLTAALPVSAAVFTEHRRVMSETSDFIEKMGGRGPARLAAMQATAAWQAAWGVTDFTLYYGIEDRSADDYRAYCDFVGRLGAILKPARLDRPVLLYYPIHDLWQEYRPVAGPLRIDSQTPRARRLVESFERLGRTMQQGQIPFLVIDHAGVAAAKVEPEGRLTLGAGAFSALVLPAGAELPEPAAAQIARFRAAGGRVLVDGAEGEPLSAGQLADALAPRERLVPGDAMVTLGRFQRDRRRIYLVANAEAKPYEGRLTPDRPAAWLALDPATGAVRAAQQDPDGRITLRLAGYGAILLVEP